VTLHEHEPGELRFVERGGRWKLVDLAITPVPDRSSWTLASDTLNESFRVLRARGARRVPCPPVTRIAHSGEDPVRGGCALRFRDDDMALLTLTVVGDFVAARCRSSFSLNVASNTTLLADHIEFGGPGPCADVRRCADGETGLRYPWQGDKRKGPFSPALNMNLDICVNTPFGRARGMLYFRLGRRAGRWVAVPHDYPIGYSSVQLSGAWEVEPDEFEMRPAAR
jgi:hypothetical protein